MCMSTQLNPTGSLILLSLAIHAPINLREEIISCYQLVHFRPNLSLVVSVTEAREAMASPLFYRMGNRHQMGVIVIRWLVKI